MEFEQTYMIGARVAWRKGILSLRGVLPDVGLTVNLPSGLFRIKNHQAGAS